MVATQDFSIERSSDTSYGGLWKTYGLSYGLAPESTQDDEDTWFISGSYPAGTDFKLPSAEEIQKAVDSVEAADAAETEAPEEEASGNPRKNQQRRTRPIQLNRTGCFQQRTVHFIGDARFFTV